MYEEAGADFRDFNGTPDNRSETGTMYVHQEHQSALSRYSESHVTPFRQSLQGAATGNQGPAHEAYTHAHAQDGSVQPVHNVGTYVPEPPTTQRTINSAPVRR